WSCRSRCATGARCPRCSANDGAALLRVVRPMGRVLLGPLEADALLLPAPVRRALAGGRGSSARMIGTTRDAGRVMAALAKRYAPPSWALLSQLGSGTGWARGRYADAVALGLWPSRGIDLHGFEVKVHRGDWLRELKKPEKADEIAVYCDFWWLVVGAPDVVDLARDPIPTTWGVLELDGRGLVQRRKAERNAGVVAIDKPLVAAIFRRASEDMMPRSSIHAALDEKW